MHTLLRHHATLFAAVQRLGAQLARMFWQPSRSSNRIPDELKSGEKERMSTRLSFAAKTPVFRRRVTPNCKCQDTRHWDIVGAGEAAFRAGYVVGAALERADARLRQWRAAGLSVLAVAIVLGAALFTRQ